MVNDGRLVYIGSFTKQTGGEGTGITLARQDVDTGVLTSVGVVAEAVSPAFLAWHPDGRHLYAVNEQPEGAVTAYSVEDDGRLRALGNQSTRGRGPAHLTVHPSGRYVLSANYGSGNLVVHRIAPDGALGERTDFVQHSGSGPNARRQEGPHAHQVRVTPDGAWVLVVDLGIDAVITYALGPESGTLRQAAVARTAPGAGPRHLAFGRGGHVHVAGELDSTVTTYQFDASSGELTRRGVAPSTAKSAPDDNYPSEIAIADNGRFLYVANRGMDVIGVLAVSGTQLRPIADVPTGGAWPRHLAVFGGHLYVANERSHQVTHFRLDPATGVPHPGEDVLETPSPACILPAPVKAEG